MRNVVVCRAIKTDELIANIRRLISKVRHINRTAVCRIAIHVEGPVTFKQNVMRPNKMAGIQPDLLPATLPSIIGFIDIIISDD